MKDTNLESEDLGTFLITFLQIQAYSAISF